jgi:hypothetical protein
VGVQAGHERIPVSVECSHSGSAAGHTAAPLALNGRCLTRVARPGLRATAGLVRIGPVLRLCRGYIHHWQD